MKKNQVTIGSIYQVNVSGKKARVRITGESPHGGWDGTNLDTKRKVRIKTAGRLQRQLADPTPASEEIEEQASRDGRDDRKPASDQVPEAVREQIDADRAQPCDGKGKRDMDIDELQELYQEKVCASTTSTNRRYLLWKIGQAEKGKLPKPAARRQKFGADAMVLPLKLGRDAVETLDAFWRANGYRSRMDFLREAVDSHMQRIAATHPHASDELLNTPAEKIRVAISHAVASGRRTGWAKLVTGVDRTKKGGYAILGGFIDEGEVDLDANSILVRMIPEGSVKHASKEIQVQRVTDAGLTDIDGTYNLRTELPSLLDVIEQAMQQ